MAPVIVIADAAPSSGGWVGWGINPTAAAMVGTQALIAFKSTEGPVVYTYNLSMGLMSPGFSLTPGQIILNFTNSSAEILGTQLTIYATLNLNANESLQMNHVWNRGSSVNLTSNSPGPHSFTGENIQSVLPINLSTGATSQVKLPHQKLKNVSVAKPKTPKVLVTKLFMFPRIFVATSSSVHRYKLQWLGFLGFWFFWGLWSPCMLTIHGGFWIFP